MEDSSLKKKAAAGVFWAGVSNLVTQLLNMLFGIVLARILLPEDYGVVGMLTIFTALANSLQEGGFGNALINKSAATQDDYNAVFWFNFLVSSTIYVILFFLTPLISRFYGVPELMWLGRIIFLNIIFAAIGNVPSVYMLKQVRTKPIAISSFVCTLFSGTIGVILAVSGFSFWGLAIQSVLLFAIRDCFYFYFSGWKPTIPIRFDPLRQFWRHGIKLTLMNLYSVVNNNLITVLLGKFYTKVDVGFYNQATKWNFMAYSVLLGAVNSVSQPLMVSGAETDEERRVRVFRKMMRFATFISVPSMFCLALVSHEFIHITITNKWDRSVPILQILALGAAFIPLFSVYQSFVLSKNRSGLAVIVNCIQISIQLILVVLLYKEGILLMVGIVTSVNVIFLFVWQGLVSAISKVRFRYVFQDVLLMLFMGGGSLILSYFLTLGLHLGDVVTLFLKVSLFLLVYVSLAFLFKIDILKDIWGTILDKMKSVFKKRVITRK